MAKIKKWEITGLRKSHSIKKAAGIILKQRLANLIELIKIYFENENVENLHDVRIALRRVRYNMELFIEFFNKNKFMKFYKRIQKLQDLSGSVRDLDVFKENITFLSKDKKVNIPQYVNKKVAERRTQLNEQLKLELLKFNHSKTLKEFQQML